MNIVVDGLGSAERLVVTMLSAPYNSATSRIVPRTIIVNNSVLGLGLFCVYMYVRICKSRRV